MNHSAPHTIVDLFASRIEQSAGDTALWVKQGEWISRTWQQVAEDVFRVAAWMRELGIAPGDRVAQLSENRYEWIVADFAIHLAQAVHVPIHAPLTGEQAAFQIRDSEARLVLLSTAEQARKLVGLSETLPPDLHCYAYEPCDFTIGPRSLRHLWSELGEYSQAHAHELLASACDRSQGETLATILYTSGTTGEPKGVMLSHRNLVTNTQAAIAPFDQGPTDLRLSFLPLSHIFARTCDLYTWLGSGSKLALAESRDTVLADCATFHPTLLNGVPYFYDKVTRVLTELGRADEPGVLRELLGGQIRMCCSGGAALPDHVFDFFTSRGVPLLQGYGLTESSPIITLSSPQAVKRGAVGRAIPHVKVRIADDGEILTRGPHVMLGYFKNPTATDEVIRDGWLYTGDIGQVDDEGYLFITGRKKELIVTSGGKNIAPVYLESLLTQDPLIVQALVVGDGRNFLTALIVPNPDGLRAEIIARGLAVTSAEQALRHPEVLRLYEEHIAARLSCVSHYEQVRKFTLLDRGFTIEGGELTPKLTLRRERIQANFRDCIEAMYHAS